MLKTVYQTDQRRLCNPRLNHQPALKPQDTNGRQLGTTNLNVLVVLNFNGGVFFYAHPGFFVLLPKCAKMIYLKITRNFRGNQNPRQSRPRAWRHQSDAPNCLSKGSKTALQYQIESPTSP